MKTAKPQLSLLALLIILHAALAPAATSKSSTQPAGEPTTRKVKVIFPLAQAIKQPISKYSLEKLGEMLPAFKHEPFETTGFNHLSLPFLYDSRDETGNIAEADAFAFLLSHSLDWTPGSYCARHAYFAFNRSRRYMSKLSRYYDRNLIKFAIKDWWATHAIGGELIQSKEGYAGTLMVYDRTGKVAFRKDYEKPRGFFDLLGDMCIDVMKFLGHEPSPALVEHLHIKRCKHHQSIIDLGEAAFMGERSEKAFAIYKKILKRDPDFADVRFWWANQKWWKDGDRAHYEHQMALALSSYPIAAALWDFDPAKCPDKTLAQQYDHWVKQAERLVGSDFPNLLEIKLKQAMNNGDISPELRARATKVAARYPNSHWLLWYLGKAYENCLVDCDMAGSLFLACIRNRFLVSRGGRYDSTYQLIRQLLKLGYDAQAVSLGSRLMATEQKNRDHNKAAWSGWQLAFGLANMGKYADAVKVYRTVFHLCPKDNPNRNRILVEAAIAAALAGRKDILEQILRDRQEEIQASNMGFLLEAYRDVLAGKTVDPKEIRKKAEHNTGWGYDLELCLYSQLDLMSGKQAHRAELTKFVQQQYHWRPTRILFDAYDRQNPRPESAGFYEALEWLYKDDPWAKQAVADYRRRTALIGADELLKRLKDFKPVRWPNPNPSARKAAEEIFCTLPPGAVVAAIRRLLENRDFDKAQELALRYHHLAIDSLEWSQARSCNHVIHLIQQAREKPGAQDPSCLD